MKKTTRSAIKSTLEFLRQDGESRCTSLPSGVVPLIYLDKGERLRLLAGVQASVKQMGIKTSNQRHAFWLKVYGLNLDSTTSLPKGYAVSFIYWVSHNPIEAADLGESFVRYYERKQNAGSN